MTSFHSDNFQCLPRILGPRFPHPLGYLVNLYLGTCIYLTSEFSPISDELSELKNYRAVEEMTVNEMCYYTPLFERFLSSETMNCWLTVIWET